uniref:(California timema) hypothetical protein n=1 Tax=Timema californicum TaxID=61474 RepID=A0A7R9PBZ5_TIMCA|nr:unnamed protein product [Timema californicum]
MGGGGDTGDDENDEMLPKTFISGFHDEEAVRKMKYSKLGDTDLEVSILGLGGAAYSGLYGSHAFLPIPSYVHMRTTVKLHVAGTVKAHNSIQ